MGATIDDAAYLSGTNRDTIYEWLKRGKSELEGPYAEFYNNVGNARAKVKKFCLAGIMRAGRDPRYWTALAWFLERRFPDEYARRIAEFTPDDSDPEPPELKFSDGTNAAIG